MLLAVIFISVGSLIIIAFYFSLSLIVSLYLLYVCSSNSSILSLIPQDLERSFVLSGYFVSLFFLTSPPLHPPPSSPSPFSHPP